MQNLVFFLACIGTMYLFNALWDVFSKNDYKPFCLFLWMCLGVFLSKFVVKAVAWMVAF